MKGGPFATFLCPHCVTLVTSRWSSIMRVVFVYALVTHALCARLLVFSIVGVGVLP